MLQDSFRYLSSAIHYRYSLQGDTVVICFHGYGESADSFDFLEKYTGQELSIIAIDLPEHGKTSYHEKSFTAADLMTICKGILETLFPGKAPASIFLAGYSLGGRIALSLYQHMPQQVNKLILLAPDGLKVNPWYWLATRTYLGNRLFAFTMKKPEWFFGLLKGMHKLGMVNASIFKFVHYYIGDPEVRRLLYTRWTLLRFFKPTIPLIKKLIPAHNTRLRLIYGVHDRIILPDKGKKFIRGLENNASLSVIHAGHQVLHEKHIAEILPAFLQ